MFVTILILTLSNAGTTYEGKAIQSIEFESEEACQYVEKNGRTLSIETTNSKPRSYAFLKAYE